MVCWLAFTVVGASPIVVGAAVVASSVIAAKMTATAFQAYQNRQKQEEKFQQKRNESVEQKVNRLKQERLQKLQPNGIKVDLSLSEKDISKKNKIANQDIAKQLQTIKSRLPQIKAEYQMLVEQKVLEQQTVQQALQKVSDAINQSNLQQAQQYLQRLDDTRITAIQQLNEQWSGQIDYLQKRLNQLSDRIPQSTLAELQQNIQWFAENPQAVSEKDIQTLHQTINSFEDQAWRIQTAANDLIESWKEVGYQSKISDIDNGTIAIEADTHEEGKTTMVIEFEQGQIYASTPHGNENPFTPLLREVIQQFEEKGYALDWTSLEGQSVPEKWRREVSHSHSHTHKKATIKSPQYPSSQKTSKRRKQQQGH